MYKLSWYTTPEDDLNDEAFAFNSDGYPPPVGSFVWYGNYRNTTKGRRVRHKVIRVEWSVSVFYNEPTTPICNVIMVECPSPSGA